MTQARKSINRRWFLVGVLILLVPVFFLVRSLVRERLPIRRAQALHLPLSSTLSTNGRVEPVTNYELFSPMATTVKAIYVQPGDRVVAGKLLMVLDNVQARERLAAAVSGLKSAQAVQEAVQRNGSQQERQVSAAEIAREKLERDQAQRDLNALIKLQSNGAASASEVAAVRTRLASAGHALKASEQNAQSRYAPSEVERAKAAVAEAEAAVATARQTMAQTELRAPIAGTVYTVGAGKSEYVEQGKLLVAMADLRQERIRAYFDEPDLGRLAAGQKIQIKWSAKPGRVWVGAIERTPATVISYGTRNVGEVLVNVDDSTGELLPQTNVSVTATISSEANALSIPREALHAENGQSFVYLIVGESLKRTAVTTGTITLTQVAILTGLKEGDWVAAGTTNGLPLQEGIPIKVVR